MAGVAAGHMLAFNSPLYLPPKLISTQRAGDERLKACDNPESVPCLFRLAASITFPGLIYSQREQQYLCTRPAGLQPSCGETLERDRTGHYCGHVYILPHSPFTVPAGTSDFLGLVRSATSFTDYTL